VLREKPLVVELAGEFIEPSGVYARKQTARVRLVIEGGSISGGRQLTQTTAKCFIYNSFEGLAGFAGELGEAFSQFIFNCQSGSHIDIMMRSK
jgi:hypothetical protein